VAQATKRFCHALEPASPLPTCVASSPDETTAMAVAHPFDLNLEPPPVSDLNNPLDCGGIPDWDAPPARELELDMVRGNGDGGNNRQLHHELDVCSLL
jgi:hypothetical protein